MNQVILTKRCSRCEQLKSFDHFYKDKNTSDKLRCDCKECNKTNNTKYYIENKESVKDKNSLYYNENRDTRILIKKNYNEKHKIIRNIKQKLYNQTHKKERNNWCKTKINNNLNFKLMHYYRSRIRLALKNNQKTGYTLELLGCTITELKLHLEKQFTEGMTWDNYGKFGWHVDHIIPCSIFNLTDPTEQKQCFHYTNLQPLWWDDNIKKSNKINSRDSSRNPSYVARTI